MYVIVPMAGLGSRFLEASNINLEYKKPKPFIIVHGHPMIRWATGSLPFIRHPGQIVAAEWLKLEVGPEKLVFIILQEHDSQYALEKGLRQIYGSEITVIKLPALTRGAAETAFHAKKYIDPEEDLIVSDSDHFFDGSNLARSIKNKNIDTAGIIPIFIPPNDGVVRWSYSLVDRNGLSVIQVGEKDSELMKKGAYANIGAYYFSKGRTFMEEVGRTIAENDLTGDEGKKEFYVAPVYQRLIKGGLKVEAALIPEVWSLGTPTDLGRFLDSCPAVTL